jgi:hypothetical protein
MAWTKSDIERLEQAIAKGSALQSIAFADQTFTFRSLDDMLKLLAVMKQSQVTTRTRYAATSKGA